MTPRTQDEDKIESEIENQEKERRAKNQIGDEPGVSGKEIVEEMEKSYIDYAMSVIVQRALPAAEDGLKPVHRRILYAMHNIGLDNSKPTRKSATVVGEVLGKYHPHGDVAVYDSLVRMAQDFSLRYPLIHGQGNMGSMDGDNAAAMRYCVSGDTLVLTKEGLKKISEISDREDIDIQVLSKDKKVNTASKWFDSGVHDTLKITTDKGYSLTGSKNHPILTLTADFMGRPAFMWKILENIKENDILVLDRLEDTFWPNNNISLESYAPRTTNLNRKATILPMELNEDLAFILGSFISEGSISENKIEFCNTDFVWTAQLKEAWSRTFPDSTLHEFDKKPSSYGRKEYKRLECHYRNTIEFLRNIGLLPVRSAKKDIPSLILQSPKSVAKSFLRAYFEGDGSISSAPKMIELSCCSISEKMMKTLQILLLRFGIDATRRFDKYKGTHKLYLRGKRNVLRFYQQIGFNSIRKSRALELVLLNYQKDNSLKDYVPFISDFVRSLSRNEFIAKHNFDRYGPMEKNYRQVCEILQKQTGIDYSSIFEYFLTYSYLFDPVVKIEDAGEQKVYSIKVNSNCHSFISDGFVSHNTEVKLAKIAGELLADIEKETVKMRPNFDNSTEEPETLPAKLPNLLLNGATGIAVGMATNIPPHNLTEIADAIISYINKPEITIEQLMEIVTGPDFPTGGFASGSGIQDMYRTGKGKIIMRARTKIEEHKDRPYIIITEVPYMVNKAELVKAIAKLATEKKLPDVSDLRDESAKGQVRVVIELKKEVDPKFTLNKLYQLTNVQTSFDANILALVKGKPRVLNLKDYVFEYVGYRVGVVRRRSQFELKKAEERLEIVLGLLIALKDIDNVVSIIRKSDSAGEASESLVKKFEFTARQVKAILEMRLSQLTRLEGDKLKNEEKELKDTISELKRILSSEQEILSIIKKEVQEIKRQYGDERRTTVLKRVAEISEKDLIEKKDVVVLLTETGYIKRMDVSAYKEQRRGGSGVTGAELKDEDFVKKILTCSTHDYLLFFTTRGRLYWLKANDVPGSERQSKGKALVNLLSLRDENIANVMALRDFNEGYLMFATKLGIVKKLPLKDVSNPRNTGVRIINLPLDGSDIVIDVRRVEDHQEVMLCTAKGQAIRFNTDEVRAMGRASYGVKGAELGKNDEVVSMESMPKDGKTTILTITEKGFGKRSSLEEYRKTARGAKGVINLNVSDKTGKVVASISVNDKDSVIVTTTKGMVLRVNMKGLRVMGRATQGVHVVRIKEGDRVAASVKVPVPEGVEGEVKVAL